MNYIHNNYLLKSSLAEELYHSWAKDLPVVDYHNHLNPSDLASNKQFANIVEAWVTSDPYKHRVMRICGVEENKITGDAPGEEKFFEWAKFLPKMLGNPLYYWSVLELKRIFNIDELLTEENAMEIWNSCNDILQKNGFGFVDILEKFNAEILCTSDDLLSDLNPHKKATAEQKINVYPSLRGDTAITLHYSGSVNWYDKLKHQINQNIHSLEEYENIILQYLDKFSEAGCQLADHSLDSGYEIDIPSEDKANKIFKNWVNNASLSKAELNQLRNYLLFFLSKEYAKRGWVLQLHIGAQRHTSSRLRKLAGPTGGYATMGNSCDIEGLCSFFDELEKVGSLPKVILYTLNPVDYEAFATITGSYAQDGVSGKIQFGPPWWFNDHYEGIKRHLNIHISYGILSQFIGMTTDSRSVFSFSRHEYFRRVLCNQIGEWVEKEVLPNDKEMLSQLVRNISYFNSKKWLFDE